MIDALILAQETVSHSLRNVAILAAIVCVVALAGWRFAKSPRARFVSLLFAMAAGVTAVGCLLATPQLRQALSKSTGHVWQRITPWLGAPLFWGWLLCAVGLYLMLPKGGYRARVAGSVLGFIGLICFTAALPISLPVGERAVFWGLAIIAVGSAAAAVTMRSAVYTAIWFALSLIGVSGLFFFQGSQFVAVATIVVYAGAIVVTFLFVIMLAQPEGHAVYDRLTWGTFAKLASVATSALFVGLLTFMMFRYLPNDARWDVARALPLIRNERDERLIADDQLASAKVLGSAEQRVLQITLRGNISPDAKNALLQRLPVALQQTESDLAEAEIRLTSLSSTKDQFHPQHMAHLGGQLFSQHLISVEVAGTVLLAALVGAVAIVSHGHQRRRPVVEESL